jgi:serine protease Do
VNGDTARIRKLDRPRGALVVTVNPGGAAARAKLQPGDIILSLDGKDVPFVSYVPRIMPTLPLDRPVKVEIWRDGRPINVDVQLDEVPQR